MRLVVRSLWLEYVLVVVLVMMALAACRERPSAGRTAATTPLASATPMSAVVPLEGTALREAARETLDASCGECHTRTNATALPRALRIFDLTEADWSRHMSNAQLADAARRLDEPFAPTRAEGEQRPVRATAEERARFRQFVTWEIDRRAAR